MKHPRFWGLFVAFLLGSSVLIYGFRIKIDAQIDQDLITAAVAGDSTQVRRALARNPSMAALLRALDLTCIKSGSLEQARLLIRNGADPDGNADRRPLRSASFQGRSDLVELLLDSGANPDTADTRGVTPLHMADSPEVALLLVTRGAKVNGVTSDGHTPLHAAASASNSLVCTVLLKHGALVDSRDNDGETPLMLAIRSYTSFSAEDVSRTAAVLLVHGADPRLKSQSGATAETLAKESGNTQLVNLFERGAG